MRPAALSILLSAAVLYFAAFTPAAYGSEAAPPKPKIEPNRAEELIVTSRYSVGILGGYGFEIGSKPTLDFAEVLPYLTFPISDVMGRSFYRGVFEYKAEAVLGVITNMNNHGIVGISPVGIRYNFTALGGDFVPYLEILAGGVYANVPHAVQGTRGNFIETVSLGANYFVSKKTALQLQVRYRHLSNAGIKLPNPGINTVSFFVGLDYY